MSYFSINHSSTFKKEADLFHLSKIDIKDLDNLVKILPIIGNKLGTPYPDNPDNQSIGLYEYKFTTKDQEVGYLYYFYLGNEVTHIGVKRLKMNITSGLLNRLLDACAQAYVETQINEG